uniref:Uncharacterized protein n=1 Tax=Marseillevirus LCMAC103 TaxID=2506604 RepID=A0A481YUV6_9VIRU|nr:MAG: hypothetical protein LCMAC103_02270 [Marseillevirus LCMAC103]
MVETRTFVWGGAALALLIVAVFLAVFFARKTCPACGADECDCSAASAAQDFVQVGNVIFRGQNKAQSVDADIVFKPPFDTDDVVVSANVVGSRWPGCPGENEACANEYGDRGCWTVNTAGIPCSGTLDNPQSTDIFGVSVTDVDRFGAKVHVSNNHSGWSVDLNVRWVAQTYGAGAVLQPLDAPPVASDFP